MGAQVIGPARWRRGNPQQPDGALPGAPGPRVAPTPRQWQPRWLLGVASVVLVGGLLVAYALPGACTPASRCWCWLRDVPAGAVLSGADVSSTQVSLDPGVAVVRPGDGVLGETALVDLSAGSVLSPAQVGSAPSLTAGQTVVPVRLKLGQRPQAGVRPGALVLAVPAPADPSGGAGAGLSQQPPVTATVVGVGNTIRRPGMWWWMCGSGTGTRCGWLAWPRPGRSRCWACRGTGRERGGGGGREGLSGCDDGGGRVDGVLAGAGGVGGRRQRGRGCGAWAAGRAHRRRAGVVVLDGGHPARASAIEAAAALAGHVVVLPEAPDAWVLPV